MQKYKALCRDNRDKQIYLNPLEDELIEFNGEDMDYALMRLSFSKATGWDFILGMVFKLIMDEIKHKLWGRKEFLDSLAKVCNQMIKADVLPEEIFSTRLICFNKIYNAKQSVHFLLYRNSRCFAPPFKILLPCLLSFSA